MAKEISDKKAINLKNKSFKNIEENVAKILEGKANEQTLNDLVFNITQYNKYDSNPNLAKDPKITWSKDKESYRGCYTVDENVLWLNTAYFNIEKIKADTSILKQLFNTVRNEMRHWYQSNISSKQLDRETEKLLLSGKDDDLFKSAAATVRNSKIIDVDDFVKMYKDVDREGLMHDIKMLRMNPEDIRIDPENEMSYLQEDEVLNNLQDKDDDYLRLFLACRLRLAEYSSEHYELDARLTGTAEAVNIISDLQNSRNKNINQWANGIDTHKMIEDTIKDEEKNANSLDAYNNFVKNISMQRLSQMLEKIDDASVFKKFVNNFLSNQSEKNIERLFEIGIAKDCNFTNMTALSSIKWQISKETLKEMFDKNSVTDFENKEIKLTNGGFKKVLNYLKNDLSNEDLRQKTKELLAEGEFEKINILKSAYKGGLEEHLKFVSEIGEFAGKNIDKICQFISSGVVKEEDLNILTKDVYNKNAIKINEARIEYAKNIQDKINEGSMQELEIIRKTKEMLDNFKSILRDGEKRIGIGDLTNYLEVTNQYSATLKNLIAEQKKYLSEEENKKFEESEGYQELKDLYVTYKNDDKMIDYLTKKAATRTDWMSFATTCRDLLGVLGERSAQLKEDLKDYAVEENKEETSEAQQEQEVQEQAEQQGEQQEEQTVEQEEQQEEQTEENEEDDEHIAE